MTTKQIINKIIFITMSVAACCGLIVLFVAAIGKRNHELCKDYLIAIRGAQKNVFINEDNIEKMLLDAANGKIKNEKITDFNLRKLEARIKQNDWVQDAELYFDNKQVLHVSVVEKEPIARIFTGSGRSFYIDSNAQQMPLSTMMSARVPVFTNFPDKKFLSSKDSVLLHDVKKTAQFILNDPFWMAQMEQIDITPERNFEMIPTVGNHVVRLGNGDDIEQKFHRLFIFYQQVMSKTGFNRYKIVDVQFNGQVIGTKEKVSKVDSVQLRKNVEKLLHEARQMQEDTTTVFPAAQQEVPMDQKLVPGKKDESDVQDHKQKDSIPVKTTTNAKPKLIKQKTEDTKPKAVMPAKN